MSRARPATQKDVETWANVLRAFVREQAPGRCRMFSLGGSCRCPLCLIDELAALAIQGLPAERQRQVCEQEREA